MLVFVNNIYNIIIKRYASQITPLSPDIRQQWLISTYNLTNLVDHSHLLLVNNKFFNRLLILSMMTLFVESGLLAYNYHITYIAQVIVLGVSTLLFILLRLFIIAIIHHLDPEINSLKEGITSLTILEIILLLIGWIGLVVFNSPLSGFRSFRYLCYLSYSRYYSADSFKGVFLFYIIFYCHLLIQYVDKIYQEILTIKFTRGAIAVFILYFHIAYIFAIVFWHMTRNVDLKSSEGGSTGSVSQCDTLFHCYYIMIKLPFVEGDSFDYWKSLLFHHSIMMRFLGILLGFYFYFQAIIPINGLLGIFAGNAFSNVVQEQVTLSSQNILNKIDQVFKPHRHTKGDEESVSNRISSSHSDEDSTSANVTILKYDSENENLSSAEIIKYANIMNEGNLENGVHHPNLENSANGVNLVSEENNTNLENHRNIKIDILLNRHDFDSGNIHLHIKIPKSHNI